MAANTLIRRIPPATVLVIAAATLGCSGQAGEARMAAPRLVPGERHASLRALDFRAVGLAWVDDTTVAVIDRDDQQVVLLGLPGGSMRRGGGKGAGPGELQGAFMLLANAAGHLVVADMRLRRLSEFDGELRFLRSARVPGLPIQLIERRGDRVMAMWMRLQGGARPIVGVVDLGADEAHAFFSPYDAPDGLAPPRNENPFSPPFFSAAMTGDTVILVGQGQEYRIVAFDTTGAVRFNFQRELSPEFLTDDEKKAARADVEGDGEVPPPLRRMQAEALESPRPFFGPDAFATDQARRLWVVSARARADSTQLDVFAANGEYLGASAVPDQVVTIARNGRRLAVLVTRLDPEFEGYSGIDVYQIEEP